MTATLIRGARLIDPETDEVRPGALRIEAGRIARLHDDEAPDARGAEVIEARGRHLAPGIVDLGVKVSEPGERHKESFRSAGRAAAAGGVTTIVTRPDTLQPVDQVEMLEFVQRRATAALPVRVLPMAALTRGRAGREMVEIGFLHDAGAAAFTDADAVTRDTRVALRCWRYAAEIGALVVSHPQEPILSEGAVATSGKAAALMGLPSVSPMAERMGLDRDLALAEMTGVRLHLDQVTTARGLDRLARAKDRLDLTAGISIHHLTLNALDVAGFRTFFKVKPPLRDEDDRRACVEALASGLIDVVSSMHTPQDEESKRLPFEPAASGAVGLETLLPAALRLYHAGDIALPALWRALSTNPAGRLGLPQGRLTEGAPADLVLFDADAPFLLDRFTLLSKSKNTPFDGARLQGRVVATWMDGRRAAPAPAGTPPDGRIGAGRSLPDDATMAPPC